MTTRLHGLGELSWELAAGEISEHVPRDRPEGDAELRALARRVVLAAPDPDETWSYVDSRPPAPEPESVVVGIEGQDIDLARVQVSARMNDGRFDVQVHHPAFADLPEQARALATFLAVDAALGEVDTELWLGEVLPAELEPLDGFGLTALRSVVQDLKRQRLDADGQPRWVMLRGETADGLLLAMVRTPLHPLTAPHLDTYVAVTVPYRDHAAGGQPGDSSLEALRAFEHRLGARLGQRRAGRGPPEHGRGPHVPPVRRLARLRRSPRSSRSRAPGARVRRPCTTCTTPPGRRSRTCASDAPPGQSSVRVTVASQAGAPASPWNLVCTRSAETSATCHPLPGPNADLSSPWLTGCGPGSPGPSSPKHST